MTKPTPNPDVSDDVRALNPDVFAHNAGLTPAQKAWRTANQVDPNIGATFRTRHQARAYVLRAGLRYIYRRRKQFIAMWDEVTGSPVLMQHCMDLMAGMIYRLDEELDEVDE